MSAVRTERSTSPNYVTVASWKGDVLGRQHLEVFVDHGKEFEAERKGSARCCAASGVPARRELANLPGS